MNFARNEPMTAPLTAVQIRDLSKTYQVRERRGLFGATSRTIEALKDINLDIPSGESFGLLGPNGAGKTTLIKCLTTLLLPTSGVILVNGYDVVREDAQVRASVGCMLMGERGLYWKLTGRENLLYFAALYFVPPAQRHARIDRLIQRLDLRDFVDRPVESLSSGQRMKLAFAKALVNDAPILVLDEPTNTLDVHSARELRATVRELNREGRTIVYTTHTMLEAEELCERVAIVDRGQIIAHGTPDELKSRIDPSGIIRVQGVFPEPALAGVRALPAVTDATVLAANGSHEVVLTTANARQALPEVIQTLYRHGATIEDIVPSRVTLEDVFVALTGRTLVEDTAVR
jgi:ABC-2 type transport system ATP-binding protein